MIPSNFDYHRASSVDEAISLLNEFGSAAKVLAGGHSLLPAMKLRLDAPSKLIDISKLAELNYINDEGDKIAIGAGTTHYAIESSGVVQSKAPVLAQAATAIGDTQVRNAGTIGGSLAHADPAADYPAAILASEASSIKVTEQSLEYLESEGLPNDVIYKLRTIKNQEFTNKDQFLNTLISTIGNDQTVKYKFWILRHAASETQIVVKGPSGQRTIDAGVFFTGLFSTALLNGEIITEVRVPAQPSNSGASYMKFAQPASRFAIVGCAAVVAKNGATAESVRVAFTGVADRAFRDTAVENALSGQSLDEASIAAAAKKAADGQHLLSDHFASENYRRHLAKVYAKRALTVAAG